MRYGPGQLVTLRLPRPLRDCLKAVGRASHPRCRGRDTAYGAIQAVVYGRVQLALTAPAAFRADAAASRLLASLAVFPITVATLKLLPEDVTALRAALALRGVSLRGWILEETVRLASHALSADTPAGRVAATAQDPLLAVLLAAVGSDPVRNLGNDGILRVWRTQGPAALFSAASPLARFNPEDYLLSERELREAAGLTALPLEGHRCAQDLLPADFRSAVAAGPDGMQAAARGSPPEGMTAGAIWISQHIRFQEAPDPSAARLAALLAQEGLPESLASLAVEMLVRHAQADLHTAADILDQDPYLRSLLARALRSGRTSAAESMARAVVLLSQALRELGVGS